MYYLHQSLIVCNYNARIKVLCSQNTSMFVELKSFTLNIKSSSIFYKWNSISIVCLL